jgi:hypothetical protein
MMPVKNNGINRVRVKIKTIVNDINNDLAPKAINVALTIGGGHAALMVPVDTSTLVNSRYSIVEKSAKGYTGRMGFTASYAAAVHAMKGKLKGQPRANFGMTGNQSSAGPQQPKAFGGGTGQGNYWGPQGEPQFLTRGFEDNRAEIDMVVKKVMQI